MMWPAGSFVRLLLLTVLTIPIGAHEVHAQERVRQPVHHRDVWSDPNPGIRYLRRISSAPCVVHALQIDLTHPGIALVTSRYDERWRSVGTWARDRRVAAAINGGFWDGFAGPLGLAVADGEVWPKGIDDGNFGFVAADVNGKAHISPPEAFVMDVSDVDQAVSGRPMLVRAGALDVTAIDPVPTANARQPRTAVGVSVDGDTMWWVVTDGRQPHSRGLTLYELGRLFIELGAHDAINLDGGGSSTMYVDHLGGVVNAPSGGRLQVGLGLGVEHQPGGPGAPSTVRGVEREVMNCLGVLAPAPAGVAVRPPSRFDDGIADPVAPRILPARPPPFPLGRAREWIAPTAGGILAVLGIYLAWRLARRRATGQPTSREKSAN